MKRFQVKKKKPDMSKGELNAFKEKASAEKLMVKKDYMGAREKLLKARKLFPRLDHIGAMITVCEILLAATDTNFSFEIVGSSTPLSEPEQYQKRVTMLQPIKDKFPGTELALERLKAAFNFLSNKPWEELISQLRILSMHRQETGGSQLNGDVSGEKNLAKDRSVMVHGLDSVTSGEVWAMYVGNEPMPRRYILIDNVISTTQVSVSLLDFHLPIDEDDLPIVCGMFRADGRIFEVKTVNLSHRVNFQTGTRFYEIYPLKGEVWAVYQEQSRDWNSRFWIVEILSDFSEGEKMTIARLEKVKNYLTFFEREQLNGFDVIRTISKSEVSCISHQIPAFKVPGSECHAILRNCWHLEANALSSKHI